MAFFNRKKRKQQSNTTITTNQNTHKTHSKIHDSHILNQLIDAESALNRRVAELESMSGAYDSVSVDLTMSTDQQDKHARQLQNWQLAYTPEIGWCLDEIFAELLDIDTVLKYGDTYNDLDDATKLIIEQEFNRFINLFDFNAEQFNDDLRHFIIEGEMAYETIVSKDHPEFGVIGIRRLYSSDFVAVHSPILTNGFVLTVDVKSLFNRTTAKQYAYQRSAQGKLVFNTKTNEYETDSNHVALTFPDVSYICYDRNIHTDTAISLIDKARQPYFQLAAIQQAALVMRVTRSPERLLFNVDTQGMSNKVGHEHIRKFANALSKKKTIGPAEDINQTYNPATMLESWIFGKSGQGSGTTVSSVASTANFDQLADVEYFHNRLLNVFKIPFSRITNSEKQYQIASNLSYDECRFYRFIQALQLKFSSMLTRLFIHNLSLKGIDVDESDIYIEIEPPERYSTYLNNEVLRSKMDMYSTFASRDEFNKQLLMQKYLDMSISDINAHMKYNKKFNPDENDGGAFDSDINYNEPMSSPSRPMGGGDSPPSPPDMADDMADDTDTDDIDDVLGGMPDA